MELYLTKQYGVYKTMKLSEIKEIINLTGQRLCDLRDTNFFDDIKEDQDDIRIDFGREEWRFIKESCIDDILEEELSNDDWVLGCFNPSFLEDITGLDRELIEIIQEAEKYDKLGKHIRINDFIPKLAKEYTRYDGYGHHFSSYNGQEYEIRLNGIRFYAFRTN
jgi:hypothetical protein